jgi:hypothetical protein
LSSSVQTEPEQSHTLLCSDARRRHLDVAVRAVRTACAKNGAHGLVELSHKLYLAATPQNGSVGMYSLSCLVLLVFSDDPTERGRWTPAGFSTLSRILTRTYGIASDHVEEHHVHAIFRQLDKSCHGSIRVADFVAFIGRPLPPETINILKITYTVRVELFVADLLNPASIFY